MSLRQSLDAVETLARVFAVLRVVPELPDSSRQHHLNKLIVFPPMRRVDPENVVDVMLEVRPRVIG
jgi:hypothetical protein